MERGGEQNTENDMPVGATLCMVKERNAAKLQKGMVNYDFSRKSSITSKEKGMVTGGAGGTAGDIKAIRLQMGVGGVHTRH